MKRLLVPFIASLALATPPRIPHPLDLKIEVAEFDRNSNRAILNVIFALPKDEKYRICKDFTMGETIINGANLNDLVDWRVSFTNTTTVSKQVAITIGANDTALIQFNVLKLDGEKCTSIRRYLVVGDTLEIRESLPTSLKSLRPGDPDLDTLSEEVLATEYEVRIDLRKDDARKRAKEYFGYEPKLERDNYFTVTLPLRELVRLVQEYNLKFYYLDPPDWLGTTDSPKAKRNY